MSGGTHPLWERVADAERRLRRPYDDVFFVGHVRDGSAIPCPTYEEAVAWIAEKQTSDPDGVEAGDYYIDAPDGFEPPDTATVASLHATRKARLSKPEVLSIAYHRNGVSGDGFYVGLIRDPIEGGTIHDQRVLLAIVPAWAIGDEDGPAKRCPSGGVPCYVIDPNLASGQWTKPGTVEFGINSWRGDHYFNLMANAVKRQDT